MSYFITDQIVGNQMIDETRTTPQHRLGTVARAVSDTYGEGEFIYLRAGANTVSGLMVQYNTETWVTTIVPSATNLGVPIAVAMADIDEDEYGWFQIEGNAVVKKTAVAFTPGVAVYLSATAGRVKAVASAGRGIIGAKTANLTTASAGQSTVLVNINRPAIQIATAAA